ncbi:MAG: CDP-alcohol phosphatidyltransferase family protein, partial [Deltaproteobacteria bacterium]|nr:CDP-alcohol phosphatidyltransferase family protein [Deltaproteobacteria bacterium]
TGAVADAAVAALARGDADTAFVAGIPGATQVPHGEIACHPVGTPDERRAAHRLLYRILIKPQDNAITRYLYRPVSFPLTRLLAWTPITPNQISYLVGVLVVLGCWLTAHASPNMAIAGTVTLLVASYVDCCDGEIARVKLLSSKYGAWIDTIIDEASTIGYMVTLGWHCHLRFGSNYLGELGFDPWIAAAVITVFTYAIAMFCIYYNIIVVVGSANSQDYTPDLEIVAGARPNTVRFQAVPPKVVDSDSGSGMIVERRSGVVYLAATYLPYIVRRDFLSWVSTVLAITHLTHISFASQAIGGVITLGVTLTAHVKLLRMRRAVVRAGQHIEAP